MAKIQPSSNTNNKPAPASLIAALPPAALARHRRIAVKLGRSVTLLQNVVKEIDRLGLGIPSEMVDGAASSLGDAIRSLDALPADWRPTRRASVPARELAVGDQVKVRDKHAPTYAGLIDEGVLKVVDVSRGKVVAVQASDGVRMLIKRGHLETVAGA